MLLTGRLPLYLLMYVVSSSSLKLGILLCDDRCYHLIGCKEYQFEKDGLNCVFLFDTSRMSMQGLHVTSLIQRRVTRNICSTRICPIGGRYITNRGKHLICVPQPDTPNNGKEMGEREKRLFLMPYITKEKECCKEMDLRTRLIQDYSYLCLQHITAACFMSKSKTLLISTICPDTLLSHQVETKCTKVLKKYIYFDCMDVDDKRRLVFGSRKHRNFVNRISLSNGAETKHVFKGYIGVRAVTVDGINQMIYVCLRSVILRATYDLSHVTVVASGRNFYCLTYDAMERNLYYCTDLSIIKKDMVLNRTERLVKLPYVPLSLHSHENVLYLSMKLKDAKVFMIDVLHRSGIKPIESTNGANTTPIICLDT